VSSPFEKLNLTISYDGYIDETKDIIKYLKEQNLIVTEGKNISVQHGDMKLEVGTTMKQLEEMLRTHSKKKEITSIILSDYKEKKKKRSEIARARYS